MATEIVNAITLAINHPIAFVLDNLLYLLRRAGLLLRRDRASVIRTLLTSF